MLFTRNPRGARAFFAFLVALGLILGTAATADAQSKKKNSRKNFIPTENTGKKLLKVSELAEEERFEEAAAVLEPLTRRKRLKAYDKAMVFQTYGLMLAAQTKYAEATDALETALAVDYLPDASMQSLKYNLAQLHMAGENFDRTIELLEDWMQSEPEPNAGAEFLITAAYAQKEKWGEALPHARRSVELSTKPIEQRLGLLLAAEFQNGNLVETLEVLKQLVTHFPRKRYYMQLAFGYSSMGDEEKALAMLQLVDEQGWLTEEREVLQLSQRFLFHELPWQAATTLQRGLDAEVVEPTPDNLEMLANAFLHAREWDKALAPLGRAAELSSDGNLYVRLAQVYLQVEDWPNTRKALDQAVNKGELREPGQANLLLGISNFNESRYAPARKAFNQALKDDDTAESARKWLEHVERAETSKAEL